MIPAHAVAEELMKRGHHVALVTDERGAKIPACSKDVPVHVLPAAGCRAVPLAGGEDKGHPRRAGYGRRMYETFRPSVVCGFGGYPALPALLGALKDDIPTAVLSRTPCSAGSTGCSPDASTPLPPPIRRLPSCRRAMRPRCIWSAIGAR